MRISVSLKTGEYQKAVRDLKQKAPRAIARAINRSAESGRTAGARAISRDMKAKVGDVKERIVISRATEQKHEATFYASAKRLSVYEMRARGPYPSRGKGSGVTASTPTRKYPGAFIAKMRSGHFGVFRRVGKMQLPIVELLYVSIAHVFEKVRPVIIGRSLEQLQKNLRHEFRFVSRS